MKKLACYPLALAAGLLVAGCVVTPTNQTNQNPGASPSPLTTTSPSPVNERAANAEPLTLPVLDAFFAEEGFVETLKTRLQLTDDQVSKLKELARTETAKLNEAKAGTAQGETAAARTAAQEKISQVIGEEKAQQLAALVRERWSGATENAPEAKSSETGSPTTSEAFDKQAPNAVPTDSRIVVNIPAFRMDVFDGGRLVKSYKIGIGYPQFPLPTGLRKATTIIFNPTWTPPDEPWIAKMNVTAGEKIEAGSKRNPLGPIKIPIGGPSLIHGGKSPAKLGTFASHGCVGLTTPQVQDFAKLLAPLGGAHLNDADLAKYARDKTETKQMKLAHPVPVELRYETIVVEDGKLHIYRDVYDQDTNTEENLRDVLAAASVKFEDLTQEEQAQVLDALSQLAGKSSAKKISSANLASQSPLINSSNAAAEKKSNAKKKSPSAAKNQKEIVIEIAALKGKGYPAPTNQDNGGAKTKSST